MSVVDLITITVLLVVCLKLAELAASHLHINLYVAFVAIMWAGLATAPLARWARNSLFRRR
jgi:hypothetical protein